MRQGEWPVLDSGGDSMSMKLYMSPLSFEESSTINSAAKVPISKDVLASRFEAFGGSARFLFADGADSKVDEAFQAGVSLLLDPNCENTFQTSPLVHIIADKKFKVVGRRFASHAIGVRAVDALIASKHAGAKYWLKATKD
jgi:hypothetical protein